MKLKKITQFSKIKNRFQGSTPSPLGRVGLGISLFLTLSATAQTNCEIKTTQAQKILESKALFKPYSAIFQDLLPCADAGNMQAQNYIALLYLNGLGTTKDPAKAFAYIQQAANNNNPVAQFNLGNMYREGQGCAINMAKAVEWFAKAANNKNDRAAYSLGYMYYKGYGVAQNYTEAVHWFEKSNFPMAKHWLGVCHYLGYGVPQNTTKALEYLYSNNTLNSVAFLKNLKIDKREQVLAQDGSLVATSLRVIISVCVVWLISILFIFRLVQNGYLLEHNH